MNQGADVVVPWTLAEVDFIKEEFIPAASQNRTLNPYAWLGLSKEDDGMFPELNK